jgi:hypothetical protein
MRAGKPIAEQRRLLQADWARLLGNVQPAAKPAARLVATERIPGGKVERVLLTAEPDVVLPLLLLVPEGTADKKAPVVVAFCHSGKAALLKEHSAEVESLLKSGVAVCLPDVRGTGESSLGTGRGRNSTATALSSSLLMLGDPLVAGQLRDLRSVLAWLRQRNNLDAGRLALWGDSLAPVNPPGTNYNIPRDDDSELPLQSEPMGGLLALLTALFEDDVQAVLVRGGLAGFHSVLNSHLVLIPHDVVVPGVLTTSDLSDAAAVLAPRAFRLEGLVDGGNRRLNVKQAHEMYKAAFEAFRASGRSDSISIEEDLSPPSQWLLKQWLGTVTR